jgi:hypothetical protein
VVDITNPVNFQTLDSLTVPADSSAAAQIAASLPQSRIVKAFNINFAATLVSGTTGGLPASVLIAGDDPPGKSLLSDILTAGGCAPSTPAACAVPANWRRLASCRSPWPNRARCRGPAASPSPPDSLGAR